MKTSKATYTAMPSSFISKKACKIVGPELYRIAQRNGCLKPDEVVDAARPATSKLHKFFEWNNSTAAEKWRRHQATVMICSVRVVTEGMPEEEQPCLRAFVHVTAAEGEQAFEGEGFIPLNRVSQNEDYRKQMIKQALDELNLWKIRYQDYKDALGGVFKASEELAGVAA